jgi:hypothetical protein
MSDWTAPGLAEAPQLEKVEPTKKISDRLAPEVRDRAVRTVLEYENNHPSQWAAARSIGSKIGSGYDKPSAIGATTRPDDR